MWVLLVGFPRLTVHLCLQDRVHVLSFACFKSIHGLDHRGAASTFELFNHNVWIYTLKP
jgi:hypothetical protein